MLNSQTLKTHNCSTFVVIIFNPKYKYKYKYKQADEEKKVEAVRDFYENAVGDDLAVERLQAVGGCQKYSNS